MIEITIPISAKLLKELGACDDGINHFKDIFGARARGIKWSMLHELLMRKDNLRRDLFGLSWLINNNLLPSFSFYGVDLNGADLEGADLADLNLKNVMLSRANLSKTNLTNTNMRLSTVINTNFKCATINTTDLYEIYAVQADFSSATIVKCDASRANFQRAIFYNTTIENSAFECAYFDNAKITDCYFKHIDLNTADLREAEFRDTKFNSVDFRSARALHTASFDNCFYDQYCAFDSDFKKPEGLTLNPNL